jgi:hypothetical protein
MANALAHNIFASRRLSIASVNFRSSTFVFSMRSLLFFLLIPPLLSAQSDFLKNPDIVWAAEIEQDWVVDIPSLETEWEEGITTLKLLRSEQNANYWNDPYLAEFVYHAALDGKLPVFKDPACSIPIDFLEMISSLKDTFVTFDPETYEEKIVVASLCDPPIPHEYFKAWRLRQILAYHKDATWSTTVEAIGPLILVENKEGDSIGIRPLFWFRPDNKRQKLTSNNIVWAKQCINKQPKTQIPANPTHPVKITPGFQNPIPHLLGVLENDMKKPFYDTWSDRPLSPAERKSMLAKTDTVVTFDPETYEEKVQVVRNEINPDNIRHLRLVQTWYWDERRHRLSICLDAVAPVIDVLDTQGNFRFARPLFYWRKQR